MQLLRSLPSWCDVLHTCCNQCRYNISGFCQLVLAANVLIGAGTKETAGDGRAATPPLTLALRTRLVLSPRTRQASRDVHLHLHLRCTHGKNRRQRQSEMHCATGADAAYKGGLTPQPRQALGRRTAPLALALRARLALAQRTRQARRGWRHVGYDRRWRDVFDHQC